MKAPSTLTLEEWVIDTAEFAAKTFKETGSLTAMWIAEGEDGTILPIVAPMSDKDMLIRAIKKLFKQHRVRRYVFMVEAWTVAEKDKDRAREAMDFAANRSLADHPDRREIIMVSGEERGKPVIMGQMSILRPEHGPATVSPFKIVTGQDGHMEGRMTGLLD